MTLSTEMTLSPEALSVADFEAMLGESFRVHISDAAIDLRLAAVRRLAQGRRTGGGFALDFVSAQGPYLLQATYVLANDAIGSLEIFLVPIGPVDGGHGYEAVFM